MTLYSGRIPLSFGKRLNASSLSYRFFSGPLLITTVIHVFYGISIAYDKIKDLQDLTMW